MMGTIAKILSDRVGPLLGKLAKGPTVTSITTSAAKNAIPEPAKALMSGSDDDE